MTVRVFFLATFFKIVGRDCYFLQLDTKNISEHHPLDIEKSSDGTNDQ